MKIRYAIIGKAGHSSNNEDYVKVIRNDYIRQKGGR